GPRGRVRRAGGRHGSERRLLRRVTAGRARGRTGAGEAATEDGNDHGVRAIRRPVRHGYPVPMAELRTTSAYNPTGDQPQAIEKLGEGILAGEQFQTLVGATGTGKTATMAWTIEKVGRLALVIAHNKTLAAQLCNEFLEVFPHNAVEYFVSHYDYYQPEAYVHQADLNIEKDCFGNDHIALLPLSVTSALMT